MKRRRLYHNHKTVIFVLLFLVLLVFFAFFGVKYIREQVGVKVYVGDVYVVQSAEDLANSVMDRLGYTEMTKLTAQQSGNYYALPMSILQDAAVYTGKTASALQEVAVFRIGDDKDREIISQAVDDRVKAYLSAQNSLNADVQNSDKPYYLETRGDFVVLIFGTPYEKVSAVFQNFAEENNASLNTESIKN